MNAIHILKDIGKSLTSFLTERQYSSILVLVDENTYQHCYLEKNIARYLPKHTLVQIKSGEQEKNLRTCEIIWQKMTDDQMDRKALLINLGGGVIGDMGGFCASTYKRGIDFIQIPTTLLSMVDASVGGKLGIDFHQYKNHIGVFNVPESVLISTAFLSTLPQNEIRSGFAEIVKHCLIADKNKWTQLCQSAWQAADFDDLVQHSIQIKDKITTADPTEKGLRKILNFGHTLGHAIESYYLNTSERLLHGEAIAIGMVCESYLSYKRSLLFEAELKEVTDQILKWYPQISIDPIAFEEILENTIQDKKNQFNEVQFALIGPIGSCTYNIAISPEEMLEALNYYNSYSIRPIFGTFQKGL